MVNYIRYCYYLTQTKWKGFKYFNFNEWEHMQYCIKKGLEYYDEYGGLHNVTFIT